MKRVLEILLFSLVTFGLLTLCSCGKEELEILQCHCTVVQVFECGVEAIDLDTGESSESLVVRTYETECSNFYSNYDNLNFEAVGVVDIVQYPWGKEITTCTAK